MTVSSVAYRSAGQNDLDPTKNGGFPITTPAPATGTFPTISSARDQTYEDIYRFLHFIYTVDAGKEALLGRRLIFRPPTPDDGSIFFTFTIPENQSETEDVLVADIGNRTHYGTGWLYQDANVGDTTITVRYSSREMIDGVWQCLYADGVSIEDNIHIDARVVGNTTDTGTVEEVTSTDVATPSDLGDGTWSVVITLSAPLVNSFVAGGTTPVKVQTYPDKVDYAPFFDGKDLTAAGATTLDLALVEGNNQYTWRDKITIDMVNATTYTVKSQEFDHQYAGTGNIASDFQCTNTPDSYFSEHSFTIKAGAIGGSPQAGDQITFYTNYQGSPFCMIMHKPANSGITGSQLAVSVAVEESTVTA